MLRVSDSSYWSATLALDMSTKIGYAKGRIDAHVNKAKMHYKEGEYNLSLQEAINALELSVAHEDIDGQAAVYNAIGLVYLGQKNKTYGRYEFEKAAALNKFLTTD